MATDLTKCAGCESGDPVVRLYRDVAADTLHGYCAACAGEIDCGWSGEGLEGVPCAVCVASQADEVPPAVMLAPECDGENVPVCEDCGVMMRDCV